MERNLKVRKVTGRTEGSRGPRNDQQHIVATAQMREHRSTQSPQARAIRPLQRLTLAALARHSMLLAGTR